MPEGRDRRIGLNMVQRNVVTILGALGAILVSLGGIVGFLLSLGASGYGGRIGGTLSALLYGVVAVVLGSIILVFSGYTHYRGVERSVTGGIVLMVVAIVTWVVVGGGVLIVLGSVLALLAGFLLVFESVVERPRREAIN